MQNQLRRIKNIILELPLLWTTGCRIPEFSWSVQAEPRHVNSEAHKFQCSFIHQGTVTGPCCPCALAAPMQNLGTATTLV